MWSFYSRCGSAEDVSTAIAKYRHEVDVVTFDVFDTLLQRRVMDPDWTKIPAAQVVSRILELKSVVVPVRGTLADRLAVEHALRQAAAAEGMDNECHVTDVFKSWLECYFGSEEAAGYVGQLLEEEMRREFSVCEAVPGMLETVREVKSWGKRVLLASDMYLDSAHIADLLNANGYEGSYEALYVSSVHKLTKGTGRLYELMIDEQEFDPTRWIHIGDNRWSDVHSPARLGARTFLFAPKCLSVRRKKARSLKKLCSVSPRWHGAELMEVVALHTGNRAFRSVASEIGYWVLGPIFVNFIHQVIERIQRENIGLLLFPARDGFLLRSIYDRLKPILLSNLNVRTEYVFLNRKSAFAASLNEIGPREIRYGLSSGEPCLRNLVKRFNLNPDDFMDLAREVGIDSLDDPLDVRNVFFDHDNVLLFLRHPRFLDAVRRKSAESRRLLKDYLDQLGFWKTDRVALVDVGWGGTTQDCLTFAFQDDPAWPNVLGLYMSFVPWMPLCRTRRSKYRGVFFEDRRDPVGHAPFASFPELFEIASRAPHPTAEGFRKSDTGDNVVPVLQSTDAQPFLNELNNKSLTLDLQAGIFAFLESYAAVLPFLEHPPGTYGSFFLSQLDRLIRFPSAKEAKCFEDFYHQEDFGVEVLTHHVHHKPNAASWTSWKKFLRTASRTLWKEGFVVGSGYPGLIHIFNLGKALYMKKWS